MRRFSLIALALMAASGCSEPEPPYVSPVTFDTATAWIRVAADSTPLLIEVARTSAQKSFGLMARPALDSASGMIFLYDAAQPDTNGFWMWRTRMPLDIAFLDSAGVVLRVLSMEPCPSDMYASACDTYVPRVAYWSALEVNKGWFARHGVGEGAVVRVEGASPR